MAEILADREIKGLIGSVLVGATEDAINPNGIELRLGEEVRFHSTGETKKLESGQFLKVFSGETIAISSLEVIDFSAHTVQRIFPDCMLMGIITPTTTMMREGISQVSTKIDAGFKGVLNWGLRNGSTNELLLEYGEPIFKLTIFKLKANEIPAVAYGDRPNDTYQDSDGIVGSRRRIPADIPSASIVSSSFDKVDPKKHLREAGYPFNHIGSELVALDGKFEMVSKDVLLVKEQIEAKTKDLSDKIGHDTKAVADKLEFLREHIKDTVENVFTKKLLHLTGVLVSAASIMYGAISWLNSTSVTPGVTTVIGFGAGVVILATTYFISKRH